MGRNAWPTNPVIYEIYPRSFLDTSGSGTGDLRGIHQKLDYVAGLGVDAIWIAPFYPSPLDDGGYDVADHSAIDPALGDFEIFDQIVSRAHDLGLKVMVDQVLNHTSREHDWFAKSVAREDGFDDWYVWQDPKPDGSPPNNWMSYFGPPAWTWNHKRQQYYWHQFLACQPNLNLRHPAVQDAHRKQMQVWRDRGVDGFRMDAITAYLHDESFHDNPAASPEVRDLVAGPNFAPYSYQDHTYDLLPGDGAAFCENVRDWAGPDAFLLGEMNVGNRSIEISNDFTKSGRLDAVYTIDFAERGFTPQVIKDVFERLKAPGRLAIWLSSHDQARHLSAIGNETAQDAKFLALAAAVLPGPWLVYQGEELGLPQPQLSHEETTDPYDLTFWPDGAGREGPRVPMPWDNSENYGFSTGEPWLPMRWKKSAAVSDQEADKASVLSFYRTLLSARREHRWTEASIRNVTANEDGLSMELSAGGRRFMIVLNFGDTLISDVPPGDPIIASGPLSGGLPPRTGAIWVSADD